jgi:outer membrane protein assembly factor BamA
LIRLLLIGITLWAAGVQGDPIADVRVKRVTVEGTRQFEPDEVSSWMITRRGSIVKRETIVADARRVLEKYEGEGY